MLAGLDGDEQRAAQLMHFSKDLGKERGLRKADKNNLVMMTSKLKQRLKTTNVWWHRLTRHFTLNKCFLSCPDGIKTNEASGSFGHAEIKKSSQIIPKNHLDPAQLPSTAGFHFLRWWRLYGNNTSASILMVNYDISLNVLDGIQKSNILHTHTFITLFCDLMRSQTIMMSLLL